MTMEARVRETDAIHEPLIRQNLVPTIETLLTVLHILATQHFIERVSQRNFAWFELTIFNDKQSEDVVGGQVFVVLFLLFVPAFQACGEEVGRVRTNLSAEKVEGITEPKVYVLLND